MSGDTNVWTTPRPWLSTMANPFAPFGGIERVTTSSIRAGRGASGTRRLMNSSVAFDAPSTSMKTPRVSLPTWPTRSSSVASRCT